ncbi:MAG: Holliday junction branch migration protein RuvA, partial [Gammaproteobacteria bacterium]|nr:Holliday junction branch migration protein RuvA [Gammaproteobacteria bacterium]
EVNGVGYELQAPMSTFYKLPDVGGEVILHTHLVVREDAHSLYGFVTEQERSLFRSLIKITGVGAKMGVTILSGISVEGFARCVQDNDTAALTRLPGVGKKTAERLIVEMRDRLNESETGAELSQQAVGPANAADEAYSALVALGYKPQEANRMVRTQGTDGLSSEEIIRRALQSVAR